MIISLTPGGIGHEVVHVASKLHNHQVNENAISDELTQILGLSQREEGYIHSQGKSRVANAVQCQQIHTERDKLAFGDHDPVFD
jgi:hypothetical protein